MNHQDRKTTIKERYGDGQDVANYFFCCSNTCEYCRNNITNKKLLDDLKEYGEDKGILLQVLFGGSSKKLKTCISKDIQKGLLYKYIAKKYNVSHQYVGQISKERGLQRKKIKKS